MADPAQSQGIGNGEGLPAAVADTPSATTEADAAVASKADPVQLQGVGSGEELPAAVTVTPPVTAETVAAVETKVEPVQLQGVEGGEQLPAATTDTSTVVAGADAAVVTKPETQEPDSPKEVSEPEQKSQEAKVETKAVPDAVEITQTIPNTVLDAKTDNVNIVAEIPQEVKEVQQDNVIVNTEENKKPEQSNGEDKAPVEALVPPEVTKCIQNGSGGDWQKRESELLKKIEELEKVKNARSEDSLKLELKVREEEIDLLKARVKNLEMELQAALSKPGAGKNREMIENIKQQHEELLSKARGMIFDKAKMVKNQELQIEALTTQVASLKDINVITKDLLEIRNSEVKAMEERFQAMEARYKAEKERYDLVLKRAQTSTNINDDLRKEYETQLAIFKELREKYELRVQALVAENNRLKESIKGPGTSG